MKVVFISDTHGKHDMIAIPNCDMIIHAGDFTNSGRTNEVESFLIWWNSLNIQHKVFIAGNHDFLPQTRPTEFYELCRKYSNIGHYLFDSEVTIDGIKIYGSPWQPVFHNWAFNLNDQALQKKWKLIPNDTNILVTHCPPYGILDNVSNLGGSVLWDVDNEQYSEIHFAEIDEENIRDAIVYRDPRVGCKFLLRRVKEVRPKYHLYGHIHECFGVAYNPEKSNTVFMNGSIVMGRTPIRQPIEFDYT